jgi:hypothetical protein
MNLILSLKEKEGKTNLKLIFRIDAGGLTTEWMTLVSKEIMAPNFGLFKLSANKSTL